MQFGGLSLCLIFSEVAVYGPSSVFIIIPAAKAVNTNYEKNKVRGKPKMKRLLAIALVLLLALFTLTSCGGGSGSGNSGGGSNTATTTEETDNDSDSESAESSDDSDSSSSTPASTPARVVEIPDAPLDLTDPSIYYVVIDGVKYNLYDVTVGDFLQAGFTMKYDEDTPVDAKLVFTDKSDNTTSVLLGIENHSFSVRPINYTDNVISLKDCNITGISFSSQSNPLFDISTVGNLSVDSTKEDVQSVFGGDGTKFTFESGRHHVDGRGDFSNRFEFSFASYGNRISISLYKMPGS